MTVDSTLAAIDGALDDWGTSGDAMRWTPDPGRVICDGGRPLWPERWNVWRRGDWSYRVTAIGAAALPPSVNVEFRFDVEPFNQAMAAAGRALAVFGHDLSIATAKAFGVPPHLLGIGGHERSRVARCRRCNPAGNPFPLAVNGREYRRRQRARRRRSR